MQPRVENATHPNTAHTPPHTSRQIVKRAQPKGVPGKALEQNTHTQHSPRGGLCTHAWSQPLCPPNCLKTTSPTWLCDGGLMDWGGGLVDWNLLCWRALSCSLIRVSLWFHSFSLSSISWGGPIFWFISSHITLTLS